MPAENCRRTTQSIANLRGCPIFYLDTYANFSIHTDICTKVSNRFVYYASSFFVRSVSIGPQCLIGYCIVVFAGQRLSVEDIETAGNLHRFRALRIYVGNGMGNRYLKSNSITLSHTFRSNYSTAIIYFEQRQIYILSHLFTVC